MKTPTISNIRVVPGPEFCVLADILYQDEQCGIALYYKTHLTLEPLPGEEDPFHVCCSRLTDEFKISAEQYILQKIKESLQRSYQESFDRDKIRGILVGKPDEYYRCYQLDVTSINRDRLRAVLKRIQHELSDGEQILNFQL